MSEQIVKANFDWVPFYKELAEKLLFYKDKRPDFLHKINRVFNEVHLSVPKLEEDGSQEDIDPFTFFGFFNKGLTRENRLHILSSIKNIFGITADAPTSLDGIPILNNLNSNYFSFKKERLSDDIDNLWGLLEAALAYSKVQSDENRTSFVKYFDLTINKTNNGNSKITMALFWLDPDFFLNLDRRNIWYIYDSKKIPTGSIKGRQAVEGKLSADNYLMTLENVRDFIKSEKSAFKDFKELSFEAWRYSEEVNNQENEIKTPRYWVYAPGDSAVLWNEFYQKGIMAIGWDQLGDLKAFKSREEMRLKMMDVIDKNKSHKFNSLATWQFANEIQPEDTVFVKKGKTEIVGMGKVESDYYFDPSRSSYKNVRKVNWINSGSWKYPGNMPIKTLTDISPYTEIVNNLKELISNDPTPSEVKIKLPIYEADNFLEEVYISADRYETLVSLLKNKKNVILQGAPGVGKTFAAKRLAYSMMGVKDPERVMMVQFHQSYSYEDFVMGFRPDQDKFSLKYGAFYNFCKKAEADIDNSYFFIIDEINRGNLSKIFGELFMLIENDKRGEELRLLYSDEMFSIPANVYIIGMMNTADRSLAILDYALRRRFAFFDILPAFEHEGFQNYVKGVNNAKLESLINCVKELNKEIAGDESLGDGFCIGHSYFCSLKEAGDSDLYRIVQYELIPLLKEYWFDEPDKVSYWSNYLKGSIK